MLKAVVRCSSLTRAKCVFMSFNDKLFMYFHQGPPHSRGPLSTYSSCTGWYWNVTIAQGPTIQHIYGLQAPQDLNLYQQICHIVRGVKLSPRSHLTKCWGHTQWAFSTAGQSDECLSYSKWSAGVNEGSEELFKEYYLDMRIFSMSLSYK